MFSTIKAKLMAALTGVSVVAILTAIAQTLRLDKVKSSLKRSQKARESENKATQVVNDVNQKQRSVEDEIQSDEYDPRDFYRKFDK